MTDKTEKPCAVCGQPVPWRRRDSTGTYAKKKYCSAQCSAIGRSNDMDGDGILPDKQSLTNWLLSESERLYPELLDRCVGADHYMRNRPRDWCGQRRLCRLYGYAVGRDGWAQLVIDLTGRHVYTPTEHSTAMAARRWNTTDIDKPERLGKGEKLQAVDDYMYGDWGLRVIEKPRLILVWNPVTHDYKPAGYEMVMVVC